MGNSLHNFGVDTWICERQSQARNYSIFIPMINRWDEENEGNMVTRAPLLLMMIAFQASSAFGQPVDYFSQAERQFGSFAIERRLWLQIYMSSAGYWEGVPNVDYSRRLFNSVKRMQSDFGMSADGIITNKQVEILKQKGDAVLNEWKLHTATHPVTGKTLWVPWGIGLNVEKSANEITFNETRGRFRLSFSVFGNTSLYPAYKAIYDSMFRSGDTIEYHLFRPDFFVIHGHKGKFNRYVRFHVSGNSAMHGFDMYWSSNDTPIYGNRLVTLISGSFWASMTGAPFPAGLTGFASTTPQAEKRGSDQPKPNIQGSEEAAFSGTGFFTSRDGYIVTNAHVVEPCSRINVRTHTGKQFIAYLQARDRTNDLALLKINATDMPYGSLREDLKLGEQVAAFGFPLTDVLAKSGNFTLGNVTALAGINDDYRHVQISAPVQLGNSGGPLLDEYGNVVGIVTYKLNAIKSAELIGDISQNVNFAVRSYVVKTFLQNAKAMDEQRVLTQSLRPVEVADRAKSISVFIECR